jgi:hypothetical protein
MGPHEDRRDNREMVSAIKDLSIRLYRVETQLNQARGGIAAIGFLVILKTLGWT